MQMMVTKGAKAVALVVLIGMVAACGLPRSGPNKKEIFAGSVLREGDAFEMEVRSMDRASLLKRRRLN